MRNWYSRYERWVAKSISKGHSFDVKLMPRAAAVVLMNMMGIFFSIVFCLFSIFQGDWESSFSFGISAIWGMGLHFALFWRIFGIRTFFNLFIFTVFVSGINVIYLDGGLGSPFLPWVAVPPIVSYLLLGKRGFIIWAAVSTASFVVFLFPIPEYSTDPSQLASKALLSYLALFNAQLITLLFILRTRQELDQVESDLTEDLLTSQQETAAREQGIKEERENVSRWLSHIVNPILQRAAITQEALLTQMPQGEKANLRSSLDGIQQELDKVLQNLEATEDDGQGFQGAVRRLVREMENGWGIKSVVDLPKEPNLPMDATNIHLFRILQEALRNITRHAEASLVRMQIIIQEGRITNMIIKDNGIGFAKGKWSSNRSQGQGLQNMEDRTALLGGKMRIVSRPGKGAVLSFMFPLPIKPELS